MFLDKLKIRARKHTLKLACLLPYDVTPVKQTNVSGSGSGNQKM